MDEEEFRGWWEYNLSADNEVPSPMFTTMRKKINEDRCVLEQFSEV